MVFRWITNRKARSAFVILQEWKAGVGIKLQCKYVFHLDVAACDMAASIKIATFFGTFDAISINIQMRKSQKYINVCNFVGISMFFFRTGSKLWQSSIYKVSTVAQLSVSDVDAVKGFFLRQETARNPKVQKKHCPKYRKRGQEWAIKNGRNTVESDRRTIQKPRESS